MGVAGTYALMTFATGALLLLGWLYVNIDNPRCAAILKKSALLFLLPMLFWPGGLVLRLPLGVWIDGACEEGLKAFASTREQNPKNKFWLVALFGIWELAVDKPFWGLVLAKSGESWDRLAMIGIVSATALPVLMHTTTAAIYAFAFKDRIWAAFIAGWVVHVTFNWSVDHFSTSVPLVTVQTVTLVIILAGILGQARQPLVQMAE
jgi:hypothetical protein